MFVEDIGREVRMATVTERINGGAAAAVVTNVAKAVVYDPAAAPVLSPRPNWGALWAGVFTFAAIWSIFGLLGMAIFSSAANPASPSAITGISIGMGVWTIVLTIIAMYVAGLTTGKLAGINNRRDGVLHGMIMFGLSVMTALVVVALSVNSAALATVARSIAGIHSPYSLNSLEGLGWVGFVSLFLGWLAAMGGAVLGIQRRMNEIDVH